MNTQIDVAIVGAGPVGLLLAIELKLGGADVLVLERLAAPDRGIKAPSIGPVGAEALQRRGMGPALTEAEARSFAAMGQAGAEMRARLLRSRGHFALLPLRSNAEPERRMYWVDQPAIEAVLIERASALGIEIRRGCAVTDLEQRDTGVTVGWASVAGPDRLTCSWLVGCDGGRSTVRKLAGFGFSGAPPSLTMYQAILDLDHPERLQRGVSRLPGGVVINGPRPRRLGLHDFSGPPADREAPVTRDEIEGALRRISGADVRVTAIEEANRWSDVTRLADTYRRDRVLVAGDAAHVHSPLGGQGLSLGLADAANLGWKLAAVIRGDKSAGFLDSYTAERRPVTDAVLANTLAQVALMRTDDRSSALREVFATLMQLDDVNDRVDGMMSGLAMRYDLDSDRAEVGSLAADRPLGAGTSLYSQMADGAGILLDATSNGRVAALAARTARLRCLAVDAPRSLLIRPDGCIAWSADGDETDGLADALERWFAR